MVSNEISELAFPEGSHSWYPLETSFMSHYERIFIYSSPDTIGVNHLAPGGGWAARIVPK